MDSLKKYNNRIETFFNFLQKRPIFEFKNESYLCRSIKKIIELTYFDLFIVFSVLFYKTIKFLTIICKHLDIFLYTLYNKYSLF